MSMSMEKLRESKFSEFVDSCERMGGKPRKVTEHLMFCDVNGFRVEFALHRDSIYGNFIITKDGRRLGVSFDQRTLTII